MATRLSDVARAAGVSTSTASRALAGSPRVNEDTRQKVVLAARNLDYHPNPAARTLFTGRSANVGIIVPDLLNPFFADIVKGAQQSARAAGYSVFIADTDNNPRDETNALRSMADQIDGVLMCTPQATEDELTALSRTIPMVLVHRRVPGISSVISDVEGGVRQALENLVALGHRRIAYVEGPAGSWSSGIRHTALLKVAPGLPVELIDVGHFAARFEGGVAAADLVLASAATAVLAFNDIVALGMLNRLTARGVRVPEDLSIVGYDGIAAAAMTSPSLTTVAQPLALSGAIALDLLVDELAGGDRAVVERTLPTHLVVRRTTGVPSISADARHLPSP